MLPWQPLFDKQFFQKFEFPFLTKNHNFFEVDFTFLDHFRVNLSILLTSWSILVVFKGFGKNQEIQDGRHLRKRRDCDVI